MTDDTIVAIATPEGQGAIGIIRLSGEQALKIVDKVFVSKKIKSLKNIQTNTIHLGFIKNKDMIIDQVLLSFMKSPNTYTGDDIIEISCHNNQDIMTKIVNLCKKHGAHLAKPGEFTLRAYLNGKKDLTEAEAVLSVIKADNEFAEKLALNQLLGGVKEVVESWKNELLEILTDLNVRIDHDEEGNFSEVDIKSLTKRLNILVDDMQNKVKHGEKTNKTKEGIKVAIIGKPNVGKSSLFNRILQDNKAIVTNIPGTTRDSIESSIEFKGIKIKFIDTAGIRKISNKEHEKQKEIEAIGIKKTIENMNKADVIIFVLDISKKLDTNDHLIIKHINDKYYNVETGQRPVSCDSRSLKEVIVVSNKIDLKNKFQKKDLKSFVNNKKYLKVSAKKNKDVGVILESLIDSIDTAGFLHQEGMMTSLRHRSLINASIVNLKQGAQTLQSSPIELVQFNINEAMNNLNEILGININEEILNNIFNKFCVGK